MEFAVAVLVFAALFPGTTFALTESRASFGEVSQSHLVEQAGQAVDAPEAPTNCHPQTGFEAT